MRHQCKNKSLTFNTNYTVSLLVNLSIELLKNGRIKTTHVRAMALKSFIDKIITKAKKSNDSVLISALRSNLAAFHDAKKYAKTYETRNGGFTRVIKLYKRKGDNSMLSLIEFV